MYVLTQTQFVKTPFTPLLRMEQNLAIKRIFSNSNNKGYQKCKVIMYEMVDVKI